MCAVSGNLAGFFYSAAANNGRLLLTQIATIMNDLESDVWQPPALPPALLHFLSTQPPTLLPSPLTPTQPSYTHQAAQQCRTLPPINNPQLRVENPAPIPHWDMGNRPIHLCINAARVAGVGILVMDAGGNACLTYHCKGFCHSGCHGLAAHKQPLATVYKHLNNFNRRFCHARTAPMLAAPALAATHPAYGTYT